MSKENFKYKNKFYSNPLFIIAISFILLILFGSLLLYLPISKTNGSNSNLSYFDCLIISTSSCTVTGLMPITESLNSSFTLFGKIVQTILLQIGGIGVATIALFFFIVSSKKLNFKEQAIIKETWNIRNFFSIRKIFLLILIETIVIESLGAFLLFFDFKYLQNNTTSTSIGYAIYHSISAFNNAGFDLLGSNSFINYSTDVYLQIVTCFLIVLGGLGFIVNIDIIKKKFKFKKFSLNTKIVLTYSIFLIVIGSLLIYLIEIFNSTSVFNYGDALFFSISSRTAGFFTKDLRTLNNATIIIICILMFIGASPGGTGAGIKTTTFATLMFYLRSVITNNHPHAFKRSISKDTIRKALLVIILGILFILLAFILISIFEGNFNYINLETGEKSATYILNYHSYNELDFGLLCLSAFSTAGLTTGIFPYMTVGSKIIIMILMFVGRLGPLTVSQIFSTRNTKTFRYVEEDITIG